MFFQTFQIQKNIKKSNYTFPFNKPLPSAKNTLIVFAAVVEPYNDFFQDIEVSSIHWSIWEILSQGDPFFKSVIVRTALLKYNYDFLLSHAIYYDYYKKKDYDIYFDCRHSRLTDGALYRDDSGIIYNNIENGYLDYHFRTFRKPEYRQNNVAPVWILIKTHPILLKGFLVLRFEKTYKYINEYIYSYNNEINLYSHKVKKIFPIAKKAWKYYFDDNNPSTGKITNNKTTPSENSENINSVNLSSDNNASLEDNASQKTTPSENSENINSVNLSSDNNASLEDNASQNNTKYQNPEDVFAPYAHLWTYCKNCEKSIYKQYAQKNKYICKHCEFHLPMESSDRIESLIDLGTWDPTDETLVSIDPYDEIRRKEIKEKDSKPFFDRLLFLDNEDYLEQKNLDLSPINEELLKYLGLEECTSDEILETFFQIRNYLRIIAGIPAITSDEIIEKLKKQLRIHKKKLEDLINSIPSDPEELDPEGLDPEGPDTEKSTVEQTYTDINQFTNTDQSTADIDQFTNTDQSTADIDQFTNTDQSTEEQSIEKKYTLKELAELFIIEERETKAELEEKEKNLASADNKDANQNSENAKESEDSEKLTESEDSENAKESEDSEKLTESEDSENAKESEDSEKLTESEDSENAKESEDSENAKESEKDIAYMDKVDFYQRETGLTDAVQTGIGQLDGIPVALAVMDFQFIGGSMGSVVGEKITRLIEYATDKCLPLIISCASGGARMQEGTFSLMQMAKISSALLDYQVNKNLLLVSLLTSPTTGGVTASFGMLGDIIIGEPDAYIAFAGKRVIEEVMKIVLPEGVQEAEYLFEKGSLDLIVPRNLLKGVLSELLKLHGFFPLNQNKILNLKSRYKILYKELPVFQSFEKKNSKKL